MYMSTSKSSWKSRIKIYFGAKCLKSIHSFIIICIFLELLWSLFDYVLYKVCRSCSNLTWSAWGQIWPPAWKSSLATKTISKSLSGEKKCDLELNYIGSTSILRILSAASQREGALSSSYTPHCFPAMVLIIRRRQVSEWLKFSSEQIQFTETVEGDSYSKGIAEDQRSRRRQNQNLASVTEMLVTVVAAFARIPNLIFIKTCSFYTSLKSPWRFFQCSCILLSHWVFALNSMFYSLVTVT